jgi:tetratricopeptide (TPR) repeat protein
VYIGRRKRRNRGNGAAWVVLLVAGVALIGGYALVQERLGQGFRLGGQTPTPLLTVTPTRSVEDFAKDAREAYDRGDYRAAIGLYEQASRRRPSDADLVTQAARLMVFIGQAPKAEQRARKAVELDPRSAEARAVLCMALDWQSRYAEAQAECEAAVALDPASPTALAYLSEVQTDLGAIAAAQESARMALELDPEHADALRNMGYAYEQSGAYAEAIYYYERAVTAQPNMPHVLIAIGRAYTILGQVPKSVLYYKRVIEFDPRNAEAHDRLGGAYAALGEYELARQELDTAIDLDPARHTAFVRRGSLNIQTQRFENAILDYNQAITTSALVSATLNVVDYLNLAFAYQLTNDCAQALPWFDKVAEMAPADQDILDRVAVGRKRCGE